MLHTISASVSQWPFFIQLLLWLLLGAMESVCVGFLVGGYIWLFAGLPYLVIRWVLGAFYPSLRIPKVPFLLLALLWSATAAVVCADRWKIHTHGRLHVVREWGFDFVLSLRAQDLALEIPGAIMVGVGIYVLLHAPGPGRVGNTEDRSERTVWLPPKPDSR